MDGAQSLIPGLGQVIASGDPKRKSAAIRQIGQLFVQGAPRFSAAHVALFDDVLTGLLPQSDPAARADLATRLAPLANAPPDLIKRLVNDDSIAVCGPLLGRSTMIADPALIDIARTKGQTHLMAISGRAMLASGVTDVIVRRGDRDVVRRVAGNAGAAFSHAGYAGLIDRTGDDGALALMVGQRADLSDSNLKELLAGSADIVRRRLLAAVPPARREAIGLSEPTAPIIARGVRCNFLPAQRAILALHRSDALDEAALLGFAKQQDYETTVAALSASAGVPIEKIDELMNGERHDPLMVLGRAIGLEWSTVRALIALRPGDTAMSRRTDEAARQNFERLLPSTAQRVVEFWRVRQPELAAS